MLNMFGQYILHHTPTQPSLPPQNLNPPKLQPSSTSTSRSSQAKPSLHMGNRGNLLFFALTHRPFSWLLTKVVWILIPLLKNRAGIMVLSGLVDQVWIGSLHAWQSYAVGILASNILLNGFMRIIKFGVLQQAE